MVRVLRRRSLCKYLCRAESVADEDDEEGAESANETDVDDLTNIQLAYESIETARLIAER